METRLIGKVVSRRFRVEEVVGRGGMAIVYRAYDLKSRQTVALKVLREEYADDAEYNERFNREAEACKKLNHPNIVNLIATGAVGGMRYIAFEYVDGPTLKEIIQREGRLPQEDAVHYALQILAALGHAHGRRIIHRDIKPQNLMVTHNGQLKVADFGIAGMADTQTLTSDGSVIGSVHYFSPEQAKGMRATEASDLYSVGVILYEMLTGHVPFDGESSVSVAMMHLMKEPVPVEQEAEVSPAIARIVAKALAKQPQDRYQSAETMTRDLRRGLRHPDGHFMEAERVKRPPQTTSERRHQRRIIRSATALATILLLAFTAFAARQFYRTLFVLTTIPDLVGLDQASAERLIQGAGLKAEWDWVMDAATPEGCVSAQEPAASAAAERGTAVHVTLSGGSGLVVVPRLANLPLEDAREQLAATGLMTGEVTEQVSEVMKGLVIGQHPEAGEQVAAGSAVSIVISMGRVVVPELVGLREEEALQRIEQVGLSAGAIEIEEVRSPSQDGYVQSQSLPQFMNAEPGQVIKLKVGRYLSRNKTYSISPEIEVPPQGCAIRITLVEEGEENEMYSARHETPGLLSLSVLLRSETAGPKKWRLYIDGNLREEHEITIL